MKCYNLAVVGATGLVGSVFIKLLEEYEFPVCSICFFASGNSEGKKIKFLDKEYIIKRLTTDSFQGVDFVFFFTDSLVSKEWVPLALLAGCYVIDNSSHFRLDSSSSLIIPEVNFNKIKGKLISNPNCVTIQMVIVLDVLKELKINKVISSTYQSVSGSGNKGVEALNSGDTSLYKYNIRNTCIPLIGDVTLSGFTEEENKIINELKILLDDFEIEIIPTCVRVPVLYSHGVSLSVEVENECNTKDIITLFYKSNIIKIVDAPTSILANETDDIYVGRIRKSGNTISLYIAANNLRRGAALNSLFIAKKIISNSIAYKI